MNVNLKEKIAQIYARKGTREAPARWRIPLLFLVLKQTDADGQKVVVQGHVTRQADGNLKVAFSELGRPPAYSGKTDARTRRTSGVASSHYHPTR
jgi:hypothetical protein